MNNKPYDKETITALGDKDAMYNVMKRLIAEERQKVLDSGELKLHGQTMKFCFKKVGEKPTLGYPLYFGLHGGGGCDAEANNEQWDNHKHLYNIKCGIWFTPRSPEDAWNMWHKWYMDDMIDYIISSFVILDEVDPNKVYMSGYSAGGDGTYKLAPRLADRWAGAAMCAGHPNGADMVSVRNIFMSLQCGGEDSAYDRNKICRDYGEKLKELKSNDPDGYDHYVKIHEGFGHWMELNDAVVFDMLHEKERNPYPKKIAWRTCKDVLQPSFYWLAIPKEIQDYGKLIIAEKDENNFTIKTDDFSSVIVLVHEYFVNINKPLTFKFNNSSEFKLDSWEPDFDLAYHAIEKRWDPAYIWTCAIKVSANGIEVVKGFNFEKKE